MGDIKVALEQLQDLFAVPFFNCLRLGCLRLTASQLCLYDISIRWDDWEILVRIKLGELSYGVLVS